MKVRPESSPLTIRTAFLSVLIIGLFAHGLAFARQDPSGPKLQGGPEAFALLQSGDAAGAIKILESVVIRDPSNVRALRLLGTSYIKTKNYDAALEALTRSLKIEPDFPAALYNIGVVHALKGNKDAAFEWLSKAKATRGLDITQISGDADLVSLKSDPRFAGLMPKPEEFTNPFVEPVRIIKEWDGEAANDQFGWIARRIGDVDGDRIPDVVTSAPTNGAGGVNAGRVYVYSTRTGRLIWTVNGKPEGQLGTGLEAAGDTNRDGVPDVVAGAPMIGQSYVYSGRDGQVLLTMNGEAKGDSFGQHTSGVGDVDHDGYADVIVGAPTHNAGGKAAGRAYVYSDKDGHLLLTLTGEREGDKFGSAVTGWSDRKSTFLVVGAPGAGDRKSGRTYVYDALSQKPKFVIESDETGRALGGMFVSIPGDIDGDKVRDIYASDWSNAAKGSSTGRIYVHSGKDGRRLLTLTGQTQGEGFGTSPSPAGDVNHDGHADLIVGAWQYAGAAVSGGRVYLYSGKDGKLLKTYTSRILGDTLGFDAVGMGDVDRDGTDDFLLTSAWSAVSGFHSGRVFIISSGVK